MRPDRRHHGRGLRAVHAAHDRHGRARRRRSGDSAGRGGAGFLRDAGRRCAWRCAFAEASLRHAPEADDLREEVVRRWGKRALISLAFAITGARIFPTVKYAMGHGRACTRVTVGGETRPVLARTDPERHERAGRTQRGRIVRGPSARVDRSCLSHARLARRSRGRGAGRLSALARGRSRRRSNSRAATSARS